MLVLDEDQTRSALPWAQLIDAIEAMFRSDCVMPVRHHHDMEVPGEENATLLLMPAWLPGQYTGIKTVSVFPGNVRRSLPAIFGSYLLSSAATGQMLAVIRGRRIDGAADGSDLGLGIALSFPNGCRGNAGLRHRPAFT